jgi:transposase
MPAAIDPIIKQWVIAQYLQGVSRDKIAANNGIGTGTVSNIIDEWKKRMQENESTIRGRLDLRQVIIVS